MKSSNRYVELERGCKVDIYNLDLVPFLVTVHWMRPLGSDCGASTVASLPRF